MKNRFDFEQEIMQCWNVTSDIDMLYKSMLDEKLTTDQVCNILLGMKELYDVKFDITFNTFESLVRGRMFDE